MKASVLALILLAVACSRGEPATTTTAVQPPVPAPEGPAVHLPLLPPSREGHLVGAPGTLEVDAPCLYLRAQNGSRTLPIFATFDTRWNRAAGTLEIDNKTFRPGDAVALGGGPLTVPPSRLPWVQPPDPSCRLDQAFIVNSISAGAK